jgi:hypothetical protein
MAAGKISSWQNTGRFVPMGKVLTLRIYQKYALIEL